MKKLFEKNIKYKSDEHGEYIDVCGEVINVEMVKTVFVTNKCIVTINTKDFGSIAGIAYSAPQIGYTATIRVYRNNGNDYTDNELRSWEGK